MNINTIHSTPKAVELNTDKTHNIQKPTTVLPEKQISVQEDQSAVVSEKMLIETIEKANKDLVIANRALEFSVHEGTKEIMVKVVDAETKEVIREIPSEKVLDMVASMLERAGILVDERR